MTSELKTTIEQINPAEPFEVSTPETAMKLFRPVTEEINVAEIQGYKKLTLDVNGFEKVKACRILAKKARCAVTNRQKELSDGAKIYINNVNYAAKKIIGLIEPVETYLEGEEEKHQKILAEAEKKEAEKKALVLQERCDRLAKAGCQAGNLTALGNMTDELFEWHLKDQAEKEAARVEAARVKAEEERIQREKEQAEREEAVRKRQEELRAEADRLAAENQRLAQEASQKATFEKILVPSSPAEEEEDFELENGEVDEFDPPWPVEDSSPSSLKIHKYQGVDWGTGDSIHAEVEIVQEIHQEPFPKPVFLQPVQQQPHARDISNEAAVPANRIQYGRNMQFFPKHEQCLIDRLIQAETIARANDKVGIADLMKDARGEITRLRDFIADRYQAENPLVLSATPTSS